MASGKRVLVIGSGGRENAICWKLAQSSRVANIFVLPGSYHIGRGDKIELVNDVSVKDHAAVSRWCQSNRIDLIVVGPEDPLADGLSNALQSSGFLCFGPTREAAQIESDKSWSKDFMKRFEIPTARYESFDDVTKAKNFIKRFVTINCRVSCFCRMENLSLLCLSRSFENSYSLVM